MTRVLVLVGALVLAAGSGSSQPPPQRSPQTTTVYRDPPQPSPYGSPSPSPAAAPAASGDDLQLCVDETNAYRARLGLPALRRSRDLERCAAEGARADHASRQAHGHFMSTQGCGIAFAENEIPWWDLSYAGSVSATIQKGLADMFAEGPGGGHFENMRGNYTELGCGIHQAAGQVTVVQDYR
jgi:uncharacterized protein YkwD